MNSSEFNNIDELINYLDIHGRNIDSVGKLSPIYNFLGNNLRTNRFHYVDGLLNIEKIPLYSELLLLCLLRMTFAFRKRLDNWEMFRDCVNDELTKRNFVAEKYLRGLY